MGDDKRNWDILKVLKSREPAFYVFLAIGIFLLFDTVVFSIFGRPFLSLLFNWLRTVTGIDQGLLLALPFLGVLCILCMAVLVIVTFVLNRVSPSQRAQHTLREIIRDQGGLPWADQIDYSQFEGPEESVKFIKLLRLKAKYYQKKDPEASKEYALNYRDEEEEFQRLRLIGKIEKVETQEPTIDQKLNTRLDEHDNPDMSVFQDILDDIPWADQREEFAQNLRTAAVYKPVFPPDFESDSFTFFGGLPIATPDLVWPKATQANGEVVLAQFMGQMNCEDFPYYIYRKLLPETGILYFFSFREDVGLGSNDHSQLVQVLPITEDMQDIFPPQPLKNFQDREDGGAYIKSWLWEAGERMLTPGSVSPKWHMDIVKMVQPCLSYRSVDWMAPGPDPAQIADVEALGFVDVDAFFDDIAARIYERASNEIFSNDPIVPLAKKFDENGLNHVFNGFPHNFLAMGTIFGLYLEKLDLTEVFFNDRIDALKAPVAVVVMDREWLPEEPEETSKYLIHCNEQLEILQEYKALAKQNLHVVSSYDLEDPTSKEQRDGFWDLWLELSNLGALTLDERFPNHFKSAEQSDPPVSTDFGLNSVSEMNDIIQEAANHSVLASMVYSEDSFERLRDDVVSGYRALYDANPYKRDEEGNSSNMGRKQSFGAPAMNRRGSDVSEDHLCLMQFPFDPGLDWRIGDVDTIQYWILPKDLKAGRFETAFTVAS